jgi:hypothetical protein
LHQIVVRALDRKLVRRRDERQGVSDSSSQWPAQRLTRANASAAQAGSTRATDFACLPMSGTDVRRAEHLHFISHKSIAKAFWIPTRNAMSRVSPAKCSAC